MMIKINLLPAHILERQRLRSVILLVVVVLVVEAAVLGLVMLRFKAQVADKQIELNYWTAQASQVAEVESSTASTNAGAETYNKWKTWVEALDKYHEAWASLLLDISKWIYARVQISSLSPSATGVGIVGRTETLDTFKKAYLNILRSPLYTNVSFGVTGPGAGWSPGPKPPPPSPRSLPIGVTFTCALKPEFGAGLTPPAPPIAPSGPGAVVPGAAPGAPAVGPPAPAERPTRHRLRRDEE